MTLDPRALADTPDWGWITDQFRAPFERKDLKQRRVRGGKTASYAVRDAIEHRLDDIVPGRWGTTYQLRDLATCAVECTLTIWGVPRTDVGYPALPIGSTNPEGERIDNQEPLKESYTIAFRKAARCWGIGRYLYAGQDAGDIGTFGEQEDEPRAAAATARPQPSAGPATQAQPRASIAPIADTPATYAQQRDINELHKKLQLGPPPTNMTASEAAAYIQRIRAAHAHPPQTQDRPTDLLGAPVTEAQRREPPRPVPIGRVPGPAPTVTGPPLGGKQRRPASHSQRAFIRALAEELGDTQATADVDDPNLDSETASRLIDTLKNVRDAANNP